MLLSKLNRWLGVLALLLCCVMLFIWIPLDVETGIVEKVRRQVRLGDAFAPTLAALLIGLGGVFLLLKRPTPKVDTQADSKLETNTASTDKSDRLLQLSDIKHVFIVLLLATIALYLMRYAGPLTLLVVEGRVPEYRLLRDTVPWKYIGFCVGGIFLIVSLIAYTEKRLRAVHFLVAITVVILLIAFYDLPFEDLLLPPNGDV